MTKIAGIDFAPVLIPLERRLQTLAVLWYVVLFVFSPYVIPLVMIFTRLIWLAPLYLIWLAYDWKSPQRGSYPKNWFRDRAIWRYFRDYFPIRLVKTAELDPGRNYIFGYHPHGILSMGCLGNFGTEATGFSKEYPGISPRIGTLRSSFIYSPFRREYIMLAGEQQQHCRFLQNSAEN